MAYGKRSLASPLRLTIPWYALFAAALAFLLMSATHSVAQANSGNSSMATVPAGTRMMVRMTDAVNSNSNNRNDRFRGQLEANLMAGDTVVAPKGTAVFGRLVTANASGNTSGGELELEITDIQLNGQMFSLVTNTASMQGDNAQNTGQTGRGAGMGAAVGAIAGGFSGAAVGAGTGAVAGRVAQGASTSGQVVNVPANTLLEFTLDHPVSLPITR